MIFCDYLMQWMENEIMCFADVRGLLLKWDRIFCIFVFRGGDLFERYSNSSYFV